MFVEAVIVALWLMIGLGVVISDMIIVSPAPLKPKVGKPLVMILIWPVLVGAVLSIAASRMIGLDKYQSQKER